MNTKSYIVEWHTTVPYGTVRERARFGYSVVDDCGASHDARRRFKRQIPLSRGERLVVTSVRSA
jgi:hypothetical protein